MNAIEKVKGPCVILAGAGTGKTYTIVEKIKHLIKEGIYNPEKIICITFSNEAANNLSLRIEKGLREIGLTEKSKPIVRTFHGFSADLLREYGDLIEIDKKFKILDPDQAKVILHRNLKVNAGNCHKYISTIGTAKDLGIKLNEFQDFVEKEMQKYQGVELEKKLENLTFEFQTLHLREDGKKKKELTNSIKRIRRIIEIKKFVNAWNAYEKLKKKGNYQDYSDLSNNSLMLLEKFPDIASNYEYLVVDEFQDTNKVQLDFIFKLSKNGDITVVGDLNQSIYRFRGAYKENMNLFRKHFSVSSSDVFNLDKSYRSSNRILRTAHKLIVNNYLNKEECFFVENVHSREGDKIEVYQLKDSKEEARKVVEIIKREVENGTALEDICVMFRAHQHGRIIKRALEQYGIEYHSVSKASLLKQKSVKTAYDYIVILNKLKRKEKGGEQAWWDLAYQLDFSQEDLIKIGKLIKEKTRNNQRVKNDSNEISNEENKEEIVSVYLLNNLDKLELSSSGKIASKILIDKIKAMIPFLEKPISQILKEVYRISGLINGQKTKTEKEIMLNLNSFYELAKVHEDLYDSDLNNFIYYLEVLESLGIEIEASTLEEAGVRLMTSHATKGLEYKTVIITSMAEGRFPIERYSNNGLIPTELIPEIRDEIKSLSEEDKEDFLKDYEKYNQLLEERRLAYVSFTRSKEKLILTFADNYANKKSFPSRFLNEIGFRENDDLIFQVDNEIKYEEKEVEIKSALNFSNALDSENFEETLSSLIVNGKSDDSPEKKEHGKFSPSALILFDNCQKQFEYKYVYNMPEKKTISWEAMRLGSFVHLVLEKGVSCGFKEIEDFLELAKEMSMGDDWESVELSEAEILIKIFFERNKGRYNEKSKTEQYLPLKIEDLEFIGFADRIDFNENDEAIIIDYKTGKTAISPRDRNWQLGFYALAAKEKYGKVRKVILDMLKQEKPLEFEIDSKGNAVSQNGLMRFNIYEVQDEIIETARKIKEAYKIGFKPCPVEKNCEFCNEYVYGL